MEQNFIDIEGVQVNTGTLEYLLISGIMRAQMDANEQFTPKKRKKYLLHCVEKGKEILNRLNEVNNPKI